MRVDIARALCLKQQLIVFDEFTSVVDREIAKVSAYAIAKAVRRTNKQFVAVTCHYDVLDWLEPDWVFCSDNMSFIKKNDDDRKLKFQSTHARTAYGGSLGTIII
jgi:ABC-type ATPase with predicted acetyltransferase domain